MRTLQLAQCFAGWRALDKDPDFMQTRQ